MLITHVFLSSPFLHNCHTLHTHTHQTEALYIKMSELSVQSKFDPKEMEVRIPSIALAEAQADRISVPPPGTIRSQGLGLLSRRMAHLRR
jgi:hypothetical protein